MFDKYKRYTSAEELQKEIGNCPVCDAEMVWRKEWKWRSKITCANQLQGATDHLYQLDIGHYQYARIKYSYVSSEDLRITGLLNVRKDRRWSSKANYKLRVVIYSGNTWYNPIKEYSIGRFQKVFKPNNREHFIKKLETLQKAINLMK